MGIGATIKAIVALVIILVIAGGAWYVTGLRADLAISELNNEKLNEGIKSQTAVIEQMQIDIAQIQKANEDLRIENEERKKDVDNLASKFDKRDFGALAAQKPAVVQKLVNRGTANVMRCLEIASGSPLNDKEKEAKSPVEANRECPSLINPAYTAPSN